MLIQEQATLERELELQAHGITLRVKSLSGDVANLRVSTHDTITRVQLWTRAKVSSTTLIDMRPIPRHRYRNTGMYCSASNESAMTLAM